MLNLSFGSNKISIGPNNVMHLYILSLILLFKLVINRTLLFINISTSKIIVNAPYSYIYVSIHI